MGGGITKLNSNAFTLIELLAIIVILAIIAVITVPIILNIIENSRKGAASDSAYGYKDSVNKFYIAELQNHNKLKLDGTYTVKSDGSLEPTTDNTFGFGDDEYGSSLNVAVSGTIPSSGILRYSNNVLNAGCVVIGDYKVTFGTDGKVDGTVKGDCSTYEFPVVSGTQTWDKWYSGNYISGTTTLEDDLAEFFVYVQESSTTGVKELCTIFTDKTVCIEDGKWDCEMVDSGKTDSENNPIYECSSETSNGYIASKLNEFNSKGIQCNLYKDDDSESISCGIDPYIDIDDSRIISSYWDYIGCSIESNNVTCFN